MQICRYKLENNTLNSVLDSDIEQDYYEKDMLKGTKVLFGERLCTYALVGNTLACEQALKLN